VGVFAGICPKGVFDTSQAFCMISYPVMDHFKANTDLASTSEQHTVISNLKGGLPVVCSTFCHRHKFSQGLHLHEAVRTMAVY
jgi:hypothetical protein